MEALINACKICEPASKGDFSQLIILYSHGVISLTRLDI